MKTFKALYKIVAAVLVLAFISSCSPKGESFTFSAMRTGIAAEVYGDTFNDGEKEEIKNAVLSLENEFSLFKNESFTRKFNAAAANEKLFLSERGEEIFALTERARAITDGKFNPAILPLSALWKFYPDYPVADFTPPSEEEIAALLQSGATDYNKISRKNNEVYKTSNEINLDFGGILKGYAADEAGKILVKNGHARGYINVGGSSLYILATDSLDIRHPRKSGNIITVNMKGKSNVSVSTSGDYEKTYTSDDKTYCHVIDPDSGKPTAANIAQVTVIGGTGALDDAVTTALMLFCHSPQNPDEKHSELVREIKKILSENEFAGAEIFAVYNDGNYKQIITNADGKTFTLHDSEYSVIKI